MEGNRWRAGWWGNYVCRLWNVATIRRLYTVCTHCAVDLGGLTSLPAQTPHSLRCPSPPAWSNALLVLIFNHVDRNCNPSPSPCFNWKTARLQAIHCPAHSPFSLSLHRKLRLSACPCPVLWLLFNMTQQKQQRTTSCQHLLILQLPLAAFCQLWMAFFAAGYPTGFTFTMTGSLPLSACTEFSYKLSQWHRNSLRPFPFPEIEQYL